MPTTIIANISFIDYTNDSDTDVVYCLNSEVTADTMAVYATEEEIVDAIGTAIGQGESPEHLWGTILPVGRFL